MEKISNSATNNTNIEKPENLSAFADLKSALANLEEKLAMFANIPGYEKDIADLETSIKNLEEKIAAQNN